MRAHALQVCACVTFCRGFLVLTKYLLYAWMNLGFHKNAMRVQLSKLCFFFLFAYSARVLLMRWFSKERILAPARAEARLAAVLLIIRRHNKSVSYAHARITALSSSLFCVKKWEVTQGRRRSPVNPCFFFFFVSHLFIFCRVAQPRCRMQNTGTGLRANKMSQKERRGHARTGVKAETDRLDAMRCPINKIKK